MKKPKVGPPGVSEVVRILYQFKGLFCAQTVK